MALRMTLIAGLLLATGAIAQAQETGPQGPEASREYWIGKSKLVDPASPISLRAVDVFARVLAAADKKPGPSPELVILDEDGYPWARSLPDGAILLTRGALQIAFSAKTRKQGDARLAFILGHELSHQVNGDFWHFFFYQGVHQETVQDPKTKQTLDEMVKIAQSGDSVSTKELQADQYGVLYATQAGYGMRAVVDEDHNFFQEWTQATSPWLLEGVILERNHPKIEERTAAVLLALDRVLKKIEVFDKGVKAYQAESYVTARYYFEDFLSVFQSREAYNNLGLVYYAMAAREYALWKEKAPEYHLSLVLDEKTRAKEAYARAGDGKESFLTSSLRKIDPHKSRFDAYITKAARYFNEAAGRDPAYAMARNNLACAYFLQDRAANAVGELDRALELDPRLAEALNNRAVAYIKMAEGLKINLDAQVEADLMKALAIRPGYAHALFNAAYFYQTRGREAERDKYRALLAQVEPESSLLALLK